MERILEHLKDPSWWFTAVLVCILANLFTSYLRDWISLILSRYSARIRHKRCRRLIVIGREVKAMKRDIRLFITDVVRFILVFLSALVLMSSMMLFHLFQENRTHSSLLNFINFISYIFGIFLMFYVMGKKDVFMRVNYEIRRRNHIYFKRIKKFVRSTEKVHK
jgi:hypothetical protein